jgi:hypothetical protein
MARGRVDFIGKVLMTLGSIEAPDESSAIAEAAKLFNIGGPFGPVDQLAAELVTRIAVNESSSMQTGDAGSALTTVITPDSVVAQLAALKPPAARTKAKPATTTAATSAPPFASLPPPPAPPTPLGTTQAATQPNVDAEAPR